MAAFGACASPVGLGLGTWIASDCGLLSGLTFFGLFDRHPRRLFKKFAKVVGHSSELRGKFARSAVLASHA